MNINTIPHPPNSAWLTPTDPNDEVSILIYHSKPWNKNKQ